MVPFRLSSFFGWQTQARGILTANESGLTLTLRSAADESPDTTIWDAQIDSFTLAWNDIESLKFAYGLIHDQLCVIATQIPQIVGLQGMDTRQLELELAKSDRQALQELEQRAGEYRAGKRRDNADELLDDVRDFLRKI